MDGLSPDFAGSTIEALYQPIVRMSDRSPVAVETLARLRHPERGVLLPGAFLPQVEHSGLDCALTNAIIARALADAAPIGRTLNIAVNVTLDVLIVEESLGHLNDLARDAGVEARRIVVELTESRPVADIALLARRVGELRDAGYQVAVDDFSPSMPNGERLLELPFSQMKFDHALVAAAALPGPEAAFLEQAIAAAHAHGMTVTAEGVESEEDWRRLRALGVDAAQGFWIGRPLPAAELKAWRLAWSDAGA